MASLGCKSVINKLIVKWAFLLQKNNKKTFDKDLQSMIPRNPVETLVSCIETLSIVPWRTILLEFISLTAASIATFATFPMVELKDNNAPILTVPGLVETSLITFERSPLWKTRNTRSQSVLMLYFLSAKSQHKTAVITCHDDPPKRSSFMHFHDLSTWKTACTRLKSIRVNTHTHKHTFYLEYWGNWYLLEWRIEISLLTLCTEIACCCVCKARSPLYRNQVKMRVIILVDFYCVTYCHFH